MQNHGGSSARISANGTTTLKTGAGVLRRITVGKAGATSNTVTVYDNTAGSGTVLFVGTDLGQRTYEFNIGFNTGLTVVVATGTAADFTVVWN